MRHTRDDFAKSRFLSDESNAYLARTHEISCIFFPESEEDIVDVVRHAAQNRETVTVSGAGTGLTGARVPMHGGIVISMERMLRSRSNEGCRGLSRAGLAGDIRICLDPHDGLARAAPGLTLSDLDATLPKDLMYPPDPTERLASLGGTVSTNASGARCFHYGATREWIVGLRAVLADSEVLVIRRGRCFADKAGILRFSSESGKEYRVRIPGYGMPNVKNSAGLYSRPGMDLIDLFIGSEGILGIFSEITVKLLPAEPDMVTDIAFLRSVPRAPALIGRLRQMKERGVLAIEYFDGNALDFIRDLYPEIPNRASAGVLVELRSCDIDLLDELGCLYGSFGVLEDWCANNSVDRRNMKEFRHSLPDSINAHLRRHGSYKLGTDFAVPVDSFPGMMAAYREAGRRFEREFPREGAHWMTSGHVGDCHAHFNFITVTEEERTFARELYAELASRSVAMGGTVSAEHGVGKKTVPMGGRERPYLELMYGTRGIREIARVKSALDPNWMLNRGNMVPAGFGRT